MRLRVLSGACLLLLASVPSGATTMIQQDTRELVRGSQDIVVGNVVSTRARLDDSGRRIVTEVVVEVTQSLKGEKQHLTLVQLGGELYGMRYTVPGAPLFRSGEEALIFVWRDAHGQAQVNGLAQGKFEIQRDPATGERLIQRNAPGFAVKDVRTLHPLAAGESAPQLPLRRMIGEIERILEEDGR